MKTSDFDFDLPRALVAQRPVEPRDTARLLQVGDVPLAAIGDAGFGDLVVVDGVGRGDVLRTDDAGDLKLAMIPTVGPYLLPHVAAHGAAVIALTIDRDLGGMAKTAETSARRPTRSGAVTVAGTIDMSGRGFRGSSHAAGCAGGTRYACTVANTASGFAGESATGAARGGAG